MSGYNVSELVKSVKVLLDRNQDSNSLIENDSDTLTQSQLIESKLLDAAKLIELNAPGYLLDGVSLTSQNIEFSDGVASFVLPETLLRILNVRMSDWETNGKIIQESDAEYQWQGNKCVRGTPEKPIAAIVHAESGLSVELYSCNDESATLEKFTFVEIPYISNGKINISEKLKEAIVYMTGALVCVSLGDNEKASNFTNIAYRLADIIEPSQTQQ